MKKALAAAAGLVALMLALLGLVVGVSLSQASSGCGSMAGGTVAGTTAQQAAQALQQAGWPQDQWVTGVAVKIAESGDSWTVVNSIGAAGGWQILQSAHPEFAQQWGDGSWIQPVVNATMALSVWHAAGDSWTPWTTWTGGAYLKYVDVAQAAVATLTGGPVTPSTCPPTGPLPAGGGVGVDSSATPCANGDAGRIELAPGGVPIRICQVGVFQVNSLIVSNLSAMLGAMAADGLNLGGGAFRSQAEQIALRKQRCGVLWNDPSCKGNPPTALPGTSLHEWGLAIDFADDNGSLSHASPGFAWLTAHAATYGFSNLPSEAWHWSTTGG